MTLSTILCLVVFICIVANQAEVGVVVGALAVGVALIERRLSR